MPYPAITSNKQSHRSMAWLINAKCPLLLPCTFQSILHRHQLIFYITSFISPFNLHHATLSLLHDANLLPWLKNIHGFLFVAVSLISVRHSPQFPHHSTANHSTFSCCSLPNTTRPPFLSSSCPFSASFGSSAQFSRVWYFAFA